MIGFAVLAAGVAAGKWVWEDPEARNELVDKVVHMSCIVAAVVPVYEAGLGPALTPPVVLAAVIAGHLAAPELLERESHNSTKKETYRV